jgi:DNA-binding MarR family transcriptional regulator
LLHGDTSHQAYVSVQPHIQRLERIVLEFLEIHGPHTGDAMEVKLELSHQSLSPRLTSLKAKGLIVDCGRQPTRSNRQATLWKVRGVE